MCQCVKSGNGCVFNIIDLVSRCYKNTTEADDSVSVSMSGYCDSNTGPSGPKPDALANCATPRNSSSFELDCKYTKFFPICKIFQEISPENYQKLPRQPTWLFHLFNTLWRSQSRKPVNRTSGIEIGRHPKGMLEYRLLWK